MGDNVNGNSNMDGMGELLSIYLQEVEMLEKPFKVPEYGTAEWGSFASGWENVFGPYPSIEMLEAITSYFMKKHRALLEDDIPTLLAEHGVSKVTTTDGLVVETKQYLSVTTPEGAKEKMVAWVEAHGGADLVKDTLAFGKGECNSELVQFLMEHGYSYSRDQGVHPQTLKKFISDLFDDQGPDALPPQDTIMVKPFTQAKITRPKA